MELLGAIEIDSRTIIHKNGELEEVTLLKTKEKFKEIDKLGTPMCRADVVHGLR